MLYHNRIYHDIIGIKVTITIVNGSSRNGNTSNNATHIN